MLDDFTFGVHPVLALLDSGHPIERILLADTLDKEMSAELFQRAKELGVPAYKVPKYRLDKITRKNHQGIIALQSVVPFVPLEEIIARTYEKGDSPFLLALDGVTDVRNLGAIARSAHCFGVHALVLPERGSARLNGDAMKTSAGALAHIPVCRTPSLFREVRMLQERGLVVAAATEDGEVAPEQMDAEGPLMLILGDEGEGLSEGVDERADFRVRIPIRGQVGSLNVSVAAGILLYSVAANRAKA